MGAREQIEANQMQESMEEEHLWDQDMCGPHVENSVLQGLLQNIVFNKYVYIIIMIISTLEWKDFFSTLQA